MGCTVKVMTTDIGSNEKLNSNSLSFICIIQGYISTSFDHVIHGDPCTDLSCCNTTRQRPHSVGSCARPSRCADSHSMSSPCPCTGRYLGIWSLTLPRTVS